MGKRPLVVIASGVNWDGVKGSERQLAEAVTRYADVLWVDPPVSPLTPRRFRGIGGRGRHWWPRLRPMSAELRRLTPIGPPGWTRPGIRSVTWPLVRAQIRWALYQGARRPAAFVACSQHALLGYWGDEVVDVLYGTDDWVAGAELMRQDPRRVARQERAALARADLVLAVGPELARRWRDLGADPREFPNGCDPGAYRNVRSVEPAPLPDLGGPVAGLVGQLTDRIEIGLLEAVADAGIGLLLVGPHEPGWEPERVANLLARPNVHHTGPVPFEELPRWMARMDVGLTPYADTAFNRASFPLKTLEYLAAGLPVVSTALPASRRLRAETEEVALAADAPAFARAVREAAGRVGEPENVTQRLAVAQRHSWQARAAEFAELAGLPGSGSIF
ncbi:glycosyltransferase [Amycolatopsis anabasis]|uniref:glycosyltransferase n=1 Tax=Amycolatopsis anabasis TaxID=1840409 RepID=UPI00131C188C|nr:glycosyltransferase [Amycolatopsis anabasis]